MTGHRWRHYAIQSARRGTQILTILFLATLAFLSLYAHYLAAHALEDELGKSGLKSTVFGWIHERVDTMESSQEFLDQYNGTLWSLQAGRWEWSDPLAAVEMTATSKTLYLPMFATIVLPLLLTLVFGKVFCSWICPANLLFEITGKLRKVLRFAELPPGEMTFSYRNKYILLGVGLLAAAFVSLPFFALIYPPAILSRMIHAWIFGTALTGMATIVTVIAAIELFVSPRWWCRTMCPGGALYGLLGWPRLLRVRLDVAACTGCAECEPVCEPGLKPTEESYGIECDNCGECVRVCPERALRYGIGLPKRTRLQIKNRSGRTGGIAAPVLCLLLISGLSGLTPKRAAAHHILGLPHYSYKENYPQAPTLEYPATTGPYDVLLTSYPGQPVPTETATLAFYIKDRTTGVPYGQSISVRVVQTYTFGRSRLILEPTVVQPFEQPHKLTAIFPEDGEYIVELTMEVEGRPEVIPFMMVAGDPTAVPSVVIAVVLGLAFIAISIRAVKIKRARRERERVSTAIGDSAGAAE